MFLGEWSLYWMRLKEILMNKGCLPSILLPPWEGGTKACATKHYVQDPYSNKVHFSFLSLPEQQEIIRILDGLFEKKRKQKSFVMS